MTYPSRQLGSFPSAIALSRTYLIWCILHSRAFGARLLHGRILHTEGRSEHITTEFRIIVSADSGPLSPFRGFPC